MITAEEKPLEQIAASLEGARRVLVASCHGCVTVCGSGGIREAKLLEKKLRLSDRQRGIERQYTVMEFERQCDREFLEPASGDIHEAEVVVSTACGAGVQLLAEVALPVRVVPALNTTFLGASTAAGVWEERCAGCGDCLLDRTGGICPIARCSKSLLNGPCGGSNQGRCEVDPDTPCAWQLIYDRLKALDRIENMLEFVPPRDWSSAGHGGPRKLLHPDLFRDEVSND
ncbi:MAG: hypothetical protein D6806_12075 [Deltaproteobacteria bacterium]|nr:MAG: hypothetical protein D6806_12075 [Deltaproteobacteria bacterium]